MEDCIFCKIINKEIPSEPIYEDQDYFVMPDKFPAADTHILLMPKKHTHAVAEAMPEDKDMLGGLLVLAGNIAREKGIKDFKLIFNNGKFMKIPHLHLHLIAGSSVLKEVI